jgi:transmembrane 9 superfamily protein 2/4
VACAGWEPSLVHGSSIIFGTGILSWPREYALLMAESIAVCSWNSRWFCHCPLAGQDIKGKAWQKATVCTACIPDCSSVFFSDGLMAWTQGLDAVPFYHHFSPPCLVVWHLHPLGIRGAFTLDTSRSFPLCPSSRLPTFHDKFSINRVHGIYVFKDRWHPSLGSRFVGLLYLGLSGCVDYYYYVFGFLLVVFSILVITCAEITLLFTYFQLCDEDFRHLLVAFLCTDRPPFMYYSCTVCLLQTARGGNSLPPLYLYFDTWDWQALPSL